MKFPVLWLSFVSLWVWVGTEKGICLAWDLVSRSRITLHFGAKTAKKQIFLPWSWRFIQGSFALFSFCKKLIQTERILFLFFKLHRTVSTLSTICPCKLPVWLKPNNRGQKEYTYTTAVLKWNKGRECPLMRGNNRNILLDLVFEEAKWVHLFVCTSFSTSSPYTSLSTFLLGRYIAFAVLPSLLQALS